MCLVVSLRNHPSGYPIFSWINFQNVNPKHIIETFLLSTIPVRIFCLISINKYIFMVVIWAYCGWVILKNRRPKILQSPIFGTHFLNPGLGPLAKWWSIQIPSPVNADFSIFHLAFEIKIWLLLFLFFQLLYMGFAMLAPSVALEAGMSLRYYVIKKSS